MRLNLVRHPSSCFRRTLCCSPVCRQTKHRLRKTHSPQITRPAFDPNNPYLAFLNSPAAPPSPADNLPSEDPLADSPVLVPLAALDPGLISKLPFKDVENRASDPLDASQVRRDGENQLNQILEDWVRNELNVMGTIREETIQIFMKLLLHPSTLAPIAEKLNLQTAGREEPIKSSGQLPRRLVSRPTVEEEELVQLVHYMIGATYRTIEPMSDGLTVEKYHRYVINTVQAGVTKETIKHLLVRASQLGGQEMAGDRKGFARAEIRVAQLDIWGERRSKKIRKLVPEQVIHRTRFGDRKALVLKQRWVQEELKMIHWRRRLLNITAFQENEKEAERMRRLEHSTRVNQWRQEQLAKSTTLQSPPSPSLLSKLFNFWPFTSPVVPHQSHRKSSTS